MRNAQMLLQDDTCPLKVPPHSFGHFCACQRLIAECLGTFGITTSYGLGRWMPSRSRMDTWQMKSLKGSWLLEKICWTFWRIDIGRSQKTLKQDWCFFSFAECFQQSPGHQVAIPYKIVCCMFVAANWHDLVVDRSFVCTHCYISWLSVHWK